MFKFAVVFALGAVVLATAGKDGKKSLVEDLKEKIMAKLADGSGIRAYEAQKKSAVGFSGKTELCNGTTPLKCCLERHTMDVADLGLGVEVLIPESFVTYTCSGSCQPTAFADLRLEIAGENKGTVTVGFFNVLASDCSS